MSLQVVGPGEASVADLAAEGPLPRVLPHVCLEVVFEVEPAPAGGAHEGSLLGVGLDVGIEGASGDERFGTVLAREVANSKVALGVNLKQQPSNQDK